MGNTFIARRLPIEVWACGRGQTHRQTDRHTRVTTIHFASSTSDSRKM